MCSIHSKMSPLIYYAYTTNAQQTYSMKYAFYFTLKLSSIILVFVFSTFFLVFFTHHNNSETKIFYELFNYY